MLGHAAVSELPVSAIPDGTPAPPASQPDGQRSTRSAPEPLRNAGAAFILGSAMSLLAGGPQPTPVRPYEALLAPQVQKKFDVVNTSQGTPATLTNVTVVPRAPALSPQKLAPPFAPATQAPNLLATTLGVTARPAQNTFPPAPARALEPAAGALGSPATLLQPPSQPEQILPPPLVERPRDVQDTTRGTFQALLALPTQNLLPSRVDWFWPTQDTSRGTPKALYADGTPPAGKATLLTVERTRDVVDTSRGATAAALQPAQPTLNTFLPAPERVRDVVSTAAGTPKALYADGTPPAGKATLLTVERTRDVVDTSRGTAAAALQPAFPFDNVFLPAPERARDVVSTAAGTPKALYADTARPAGAASLPGPAERPRDVVDASRGTAAAALQPAAPVVNVTLLPNERPRDVVDTTRGTFRALLALPAQNTFLPAPERARDVVSTAAGTPKALYADRTPPAGAASLLTTNRGRDVVDTSRGTPATLAQPTFPVKNVFLLAPERALDVVDTSHGTPKTLYADPTQPPGAASLLNPERVRDVVNTAASTPATLAPPGETPPPEPPPAEEEFPLGLENVARPNVRIRGLTAPKAERFAPKAERFAPKPVAGELPAPDPQVLEPVTARPLTARARVVVHAATATVSELAARPATAIAAQVTRPATPFFRPLPRLWALPDPAVVLPAVTQPAVELVPDPVLERMALDEENRRRAAALALRLLGD